MAELKDEEIRRFISFLKDIVNEEVLSAIEGELRSEDREDFIREPEFLSYFSTRFVEIENWRLRIIPYTQMRMIQRGIKISLVVEIFRRFIEYCRANNEIITVGAYSILKKIEKKTVTLRIDVDEINDNSGEAHTVTVFIGYGDTENTIFLSLEQ
jgi:hypothetical protein